MSLLPPLHLSRRFASKNRCYAGYQAGLSATKALKGSIATLNEASMIISMLAPTIIGGIKAASTAELGIKNKARPDSIAPVKK